MREYFSNVFESGFDVKNVLISYVVFVILYFRNKCNRNNLVCFWTVVFAIYPNLPSIVVPLLVFRRQITTLVDMTSLNVLWTVTLKGMGQLLNSTKPTKLEVKHEL